jgi:two-component system, NtrC family, response regulator AtoC
MAAGGLLYPIPDYLVRIPSMKNQILMARLLMVSRDSEVLRAVCKTVESNPWQLIIASSVWDAMEKLQSELSVDVLMIDLPSRDTDGLRCLRWLRQLRPELPILIIDRDQQAGAKLHSIRVDSGEYLVAPLSVHLLQAAIQRSLLSTRDGSEMDITTNDLEQPGNGRLFIGASPKMHRLSAQLAMLAETDLPVFISGEPGSGKEMIARLLHQMSARSRFAFAKVDCAAFSGELLEREIFGCEPPQGEAYTGGALGKLELCVKGTLFLDEITEMPQHLQSRMADAIRSGRIIRPGSFEAIEIAVRVVAASSLSIERAICEHRIVPELSGHFGEPEIRVPPLRERKEELHLLAAHFMHQLSRQFGLAPRGFSVAMEEAWQSYQWPGNVRELKKEVRRYLTAGEIVSGEEKTAPDQTCEAVQTIQPQPSSENPPMVPARHRVTDIGGYKSLRLMIRSVREEAERAAIASALEKTGWNRKAAARLLKVSYRSILYKIEQYQMNMPDRTTPSASSALEPFSTGKAEAINADHKGALSVASPRAVRSMS